MILIKHRVYQILQSKHNIDVCKELTDKLVEKHTYHMFLK